MRSIGHHACFLNHTILTKQSESMNKFLVIIVAIWAILLVAGAAIAGQPQLVKEQSSVSYHMVHVLHKVDATSSDVQYEVTLDASNHVTSVVAQVDVTTFNSGNSNRDSHAMEVIDAITYPAAGYQSSSVTQKGDSLFVAGKLTFHGVTHDIGMNGTATWAADTLKVQGRFPVSLTQFQVERPAFLMVPVQDTVWFDVNAVFKSGK
jgi:polyisoprenoid-binding protein YceI